MKSGRTQVEIIALYEELGSYRAVGALLGCDHKTVKRYVQAAGEAGQLAPALQRARVTDDFSELIAGRVQQSGGMVTGRRLMRIMRAAGYEGSERSLRRALAEAKAAWRARQALEGRVYRPWVSEPGEWMLCDWGAAGTVPTPAGPRKLSFFSSVLGFSRYRTVSFSCSERFGALAVGLAHSFEAAGGVPARVLFDNPKTITTGHLAGAAVLNPDLVRLAAHYRFSPRTTERSDPESKGKVEAVVRFTKSDLIPYEGFSSLDEANQAGAAWCVVQPKARSAGDGKYSLTIMPTAEVLRDLLNDASFGQRIPEDEIHELAEYFVETDQWRRLWSDERDIVLGPKGSGKSALPGPGWRAHELGG